MVLILLSIPSEWHRWQSMLLGIDREIPLILHHDKAIKVKLDAVIKAFR